jgi:regulator of nucleoside diphosphate kinase
VVAPQDMPPDVVTMHSDVVCQVEGDAAEQHWTLVYPDEADLAGGKLSVLSPVGHALLGLKPGQTMSYLLPDGRRQAVKLLSLVYQPEANGQYAL